MWVSPFGAVHDAFNTSWENGLKRLRHLGFLLEKQVRWRWSHIYDQPGFKEQTKGIQENVKKKQKQKI